MRLNPLNPNLRLNLGPFDGESFRLAEGNLDGPRLILHVVEVLAEELAVFFARLYGDDYPVVDVQIRALSRLLYSRDEEYGLKVKILDK